MKTKNIFRPLRADEIECRVGATVTKNGRTSASVLLYKDARADMNMLDETFGVFGWQRRHETINGRLFCAVSVKGPDGEWITKQDVGVESNTEAVKGEASDAFKRACFNLGIGRELYTAPQIWVNCEEGEVSGGKVRLYLTVTDIAYDADGRISYLVLSDRRGERYRYGALREGEMLERAKRELENSADMQMLVQAYNRWKPFLAGNEDFIACGKSVQEKLVGHAA